MKWVKLTKFFQGGSKTDYMFVEDERLATHDDEQELMEEWGENSDGGHAYGYRVEIEVLPDGEIPPYEWLLKAVKRTKEAIEYLTLKTVKTKEELQALENLLK